MDRKQRTKLAQDCYSKWRSWSAGVPQGTKLGPWLFLTMINDIDTPVDLWKYVDDTTISEVVGKGHENDIQRVEDSLSRQSNSDGFNETRCKELRISSEQNKPNFDPIMVKGKPLELVTYFKVPDLNINSGRLLQNPTMYILYATIYIDSTSTQDIFIQRLHSFNFNIWYFHSMTSFIQLQHLIFSFNDFIHSTSTQDIFIQWLHSFNFNTGYFCARRIFIQLQRPKLRFIERTYLFNFNKTYSFNSSQVPGHR